MKKERGNLIKPTKQLIKNLKDKGVSFELVSEEDAINFLDKHNYYIKISSYRFNFIKNNNHYVGLDFFHLKELSTIDMHLKFIILKTCLNIEHSIKVNLLKDMELKGIDGFQIILDYINKYPKVIKVIEYNKKTSYVRGLLDKYHDNKYPVWVFLEVISFGELINFYKYYNENYDYNLVNPLYLYLVRNIRNAAAHSNCIIHNLTDRAGYYEDDMVKKIKSIIPSYKDHTIRNRLKNRTIQDFSALIIVMDLVIKSEPIKMNRLDEIKTFFENRMIRNKECFKSSPAIGQSYEFVKSIIDIFANQ